MSIIMDEAVDQMKLTVLADMNIRELQRYRCKQPFDDRYCLEILRRALVEQNDEAWSVLQQCFSETIRGWLRGHPNRDVALLRDTEENYIAQTFSRFWYAVRDQSMEFATLYSVLSYLHATLNGIIIDTLRSHLRFSTKEALLPEQGYCEDPSAEDRIGLQYLWECILSLLSDERERRLAYLLYHCGLKPREIVVRCSQEFDDVKEIYRLNHNIIERLRRNKDRLRYVLGS